MVLRNVNISNKIDESDFLDAFVQVFFSFFLLFLPFVVLAWVSSEDDAYDLAAHLHDIRKYFASGELAMPVFGITGAVFYLLFRRSGPISLIMTSIISLLVIGVVLVSGFLIGGNSGFEKDLADRKVVATFYCYLVINLIWLYALWKSKKQPPSSQPPPDQQQRNAKLLVERARSRQ